MATAPSTPTPPIPQQHPEPPMSKAEKAKAGERKLLLLLVADWLKGDRTHAGEIAELLAEAQAEDHPPSATPVPSAAVH